MVMHRRIVGANGHRPLAHASDSQALLQCRKGVCVCVGGVQGMFGAAVYTRSSSAHQNPILVLPAHHVPSLSSDLCQQNKLAQVPGHPLVVRQHMEK